MIFTLHEIFTNGRHFLAFIIYIYRETITLYFSLRIMLIIIYYYSKLKNGLHFMTSKW